MVGLGVGSWGAGRYLRGRIVSSRFPALRLYALTELLIGLSAILVPHELVWGRILLEKLDASTPLPVAAYYVAAGLWIGLTLVPWCACMGATFPFAMAAIRENLSSESARSFSYLYLANVLGAVTGAAIPLLLIESLGFQGTLHVGAVLNLGLGTAALVLSLRGEQPRVEEEKHSAAPKIPGPTPAFIPASSAWPYFILFATGFTSMGAEVVWIRLFTPALGTVVYAFAAILGLYLAATYVGSLMYRSRKFGEAGPGNFFLACVALSVVLPLLVCDPRLNIIYHLRVVGILPFSLVVGFVTPMILDRVSQGDLERAGRGYAINIIGCVLGPLVSGFLLLPLLGERFTLLALALPWIAVSFRPAPLADPARLQPRVWLKPALTGLISLVLVFATNDFESQFTPREVRHDSTATVTAIGATRIQKMLLVNGVSMTGLSPVTKMIAHLPLAFLPRPPKNALIICFGMGTTHRSMLSWGVPTTTVELVPSVVALFPFFHADANQIMRSPLSHVVIDDGRF